MQKKTKYSKVHSICSRFILVGLVSGVAAITIGVTGLTSMKKISNNSSITSDANTIHNIITQDQVNEALYQHYLDPNYLETIIKDLDTITNLSHDLEKHASGTYKKALKDIVDKVAQYKQNYNSIIELQDQRGYETTVGEYANFVASVSELSDSFNKLVNNNDWIELSWYDTSLANGKSATIGGKEYKKITYNKQLPVQVKRDNISFRIGGTFQYNKSYYITNPKLIKGKKEIPIDLTAVGDLYSSGDGLKSAEITTFNGQPAIKVTASFKANQDTSWEESATQIYVKDSEIQDYTDLYYDIYFEPSSENFGFKCGGGITGVYAFQDKINELNSMIASYSQTVIEGSDMEESKKQITELFNDLKVNIPKYTSDQTLADTSLQLLNKVTQQFDSLSEQDKTMLSIKTDNKGLLTNLVNTCESIKTKAMNDNSNKLRTTRILIFTILALAIGILAVVILLIVRSIQNNLNTFRTALDQITEGKISVRIKQEKQDEFSLFGDSINKFLDKLQGVIENLQNVALGLSSFGTQLETKASDTKKAADLITEAISQVSTGALEQASDIESSSAQVTDMCENMDSIISKMTHLSDTMNSVTEKSSDAANIMIELNHSTDITTEAFTHIAEQIHKTDDSVNQIQSAVNLIASIASRTNLLSLNASIEAARAGEAGRGFAVVASEIQQLAEQTNNSAKIINQIIVTLSGESQKTVQSIQEVTTMINEQKDKLNQTKECFTFVSEAFSSTEEEIKHVLGDASSCGKAGDSVSQLMMNLSAIAEENASSAEYTSDSMTDLNNTTMSLSETAQELKECADKLNDDLNFFIISENIQDNKQ